MKARSQPMGPKAVRGSDAARRLAALLLEAWCGVRSALAASEAMGVAVTRFYQLEARALQAIVSALEPRPRGRQRTAASELIKLKSERQKLGREVERYQTLYRMSQRALGVTEAKPHKPGKDAGGKRRRRPRQRARGEVVAAVLQGPANAPAEASDADRAAEQGSGPRGQPRGRDDGEGAVARDPADTERRAVGGRGV